MTATSTLNKAVEHFLSIRGYENIQAVDFAPINFIAQEEDAAVLIHAELVTDDLEIEGFKRGEAERALFEAAKNGLIDINVRIRFDTISVALINESNALIRHHIDCLN